MNVRMISRLVVVLGLVVGIVGVFVSAEAAGTGKCWAGTSGCYHWASTGYPFTLKVENDVSSSWLPYLREAIADWTSGAVLNGRTTPDTPVRMTETNNYSSTANCAAISGRDRVCSRNYGYNGWLGIASIWLSNGHIVAGTVKLNDSYFNSPTYNTPIWRALVACQELGHTIGLGHQNENFSNPNTGSCMDYTSQPGGPPSNRYPNSDDYATLREIYNHTQAANSYDSSAGSGAIINGRQGGPDDALPPGAGPQHGDEFVRDLGNGLSVVSHVFWIDKGKP